MRATNQSSKNISIFGTAPTRRQQVKERLIEEFKASQLPDGARLPTSRALAKQLDVSISTVQQAYRELADEGRVRSGVGRGTYYIAPESAPQSSQQSRKSIAVSSGMTSQEGGSPWSSQIISGVFDEAAHASPPVPVVSIAALEGEAMIREVIETTAGLICISGTLAEQFIPFFQAADKPIVSFNPAAFPSTKDFVSPDYFAFHALFAQACHEEGARHFTFINRGDIFPKSASSQLRLSGLATGLAFHLGRTASLTVEPSESTTERSGYLAAKAAFSKKGKRPDVLICSGDNLALGALRYLSEAKISVPGEVMVLGGSGLLVPETANAGLSMMLQPMEALGRKAFKILMQRISDPTHSLPGEYVACDYCPGQTTTEAVNRRMNELLHPEPK